MIDAHIHLDQYPKDQLQQFIHHWHANGIEGVVAVSTNLRSSYATLELSVQYPHFVYPCIGWHPEQRLPNEQEKNELFNLIKTEKNRIAGIGEIGLPYYALDQLGLSALESYAELFTNFIKVAVAYELPVNIHAVYEGAAIAYHILKKEHAQHAHFHWLKTDFNVIKNIIQSGYFISITPEVCYRERDIPLVQNTPIEQLLVETDGPWEFRGPFSSKTTTPLFLFESVAKISQVKECPIDELKHRINRNTRELYKKLCI